MKKTIIIIIVAVLLMAGVTGVLYHKANKYFTKLRVATEEKQHQYDAEKMFQDQQVVEFCRAAEKGDTAKMDELLKQGVNIDAEGQGGITPFLWLLKYSKIQDQEIMKKSFKYFVDEKADPLKIYNEYSRIGLVIENNDTVLHFISGLKDSYYLKTLLESGDVKSVDFKLTESTLPTSILRAYFSDRFNNFKLLLDYGANINNKTHGVIENVLLDIVSIKYSWNYTYELLKRGVNYTGTTRYNKPSVIWAIENYEYIPSIAIKSQGIDYRQKCVEFLEDKGYEIHPDMPAAERYVKENGKYILYVNEKYNKDGKIVGDKDKWVLFEKSSRYEKPMTKEEREKAEKEENAIYELQQAIVK